MKQTYNPNKIIVHAGWVGDDFFIWGEQKQHKRYKEYNNFQYPFLYSPFELKLAIFRNDPTSFYGTFIETKQANILAPICERYFYSYIDTVQIYQARPTDESFVFPIEGIALPMNELPKYFPTIQSLRNRPTFLLAEDYQFWMNLFQLVAEKVKVGEIFPTTKGTWEVTNTKWDEWGEALPLSSLSLDENRPKQFVTEEEKLTAITKKANHFCHAFIQHFIQEDQNVNEAFQALINHDAVKKVFAKQKSDIQQTTLLEKLGIIEEAPFHTGILMTEGDSLKDPWKITLFTQDKNDPSIMLFLSDLQLGNHPWRVNPVSKVKVDLDQMKRSIPLLQSMSIVNPEIEISKEDAYSILTSYFQTLQSIGVKLVAPSWWSASTQQMKATIAVDGVKENARLNWEQIAQFNYQVSIGNVSLNEDEFQHLVKQKEPFVKINGKWIQWDVNEAEKLQKQLEQRKDNMTYLDVWKSYIVEDDELSPSFLLEDELLNDFQKIANKQFTTIEPPKTLNGKLRKYQEEGFSWLYHMRQVEFGACLADDMGLGKTIQTIAYLLKVLETNNEHQDEPFLLICPTSLISNWQNECKKFAPSLNVYIHHGQNRYDVDQFMEKSDKIDLVITSYSLAFRDEDFFMAFHWQALILDEAQHVKNIDTKQRQAIKKMTSNHKIALTGTPMENRLKELWSIIDLLNHRYLGSYKQFHQSFVKPIEENNDEKRLSELQQLIRPFILRRTKADKNLQLQLPDKQEQLYRIGLTVEQATLYQAIVNQLFSSIEEVRPIERRAIILSSLTKLKQICNHPAQFLKTKGQLAGRSEKWDLLVTLVEQIIERDEKVLIFTQYKEMAKLIYEGLSEMFQTNISYLDGSLDRKNREKQITQFMSQDDTNIFILSLKAGGVGLNLTAANHVIHYDRWWNPAVENQATDRAYRIGQTKNVTVHKFITTGTLEERINDLLENKQKLSEQILHSGEQSFTELSTEQLKELLALTTSESS